MRTKTFAHALLADCAKQRPAGYLAELTKAKVSEDAEGVTFDVDHPVYRALQTQHRSRYDLHALGLVKAAQEQARANAPKPIEPVPREQWPRWATLVAARAQPGESGVGDTLARLYRRVGGDVYKRMRKWLKMPCNCERDQARLNTLYGY